MSLWTSQLHYDLRFECNDVLHRMFKGFQILLFVYIASGSGGWDLTALDPPYAGVPDSPTPDEVQSSVDHGGFVMWRQLTGRGGEAVLPDRQCCHRRTLRSPRGAVSDRYAPPRRC